MNTRMFLPAVPLLALFSVACVDAIDDVADFWGGLTAQLVVEGLILGVSQPDELDLSATDFAPGTGFTAFLADAGEVRDLETAPISGATVSVQGATADEQGNGTYTYVDDGSLAYAPNARWTMSVTINGDVATADVTLPPEANVVVPDQHPTGQALTLPLAGQPFDSVLIVVIDMETGDVVFSNQPEGITELYEFTHGDGIEDVTIPGTTFGKEGVYALGVAGMVTTEAADLTEMNTAISAVLAGSMKLFPVCTLPAEACALL